MTTLVKVSPRRRQSSSKRELFSFELLTGKGRSQTGKMKALLVRELLSLTLAGNRQLAKILQSFRMMLGLNTLLPEDLGDQWLSRHVHGQKLPSEISDQRARSERRKKLVAGEEKVEHIVLRVYAAEVLKPQSKGKPRHQLLAVAYHLRRQWLHVQLIDISESYLGRDTEKKRDDHARMLTRRQWQGVAQTIKERAGAEGSDPDVALVIHLPLGCGIHDLLTAPSVSAVEDMPEIPAEAIGITYRIKQSKRDPLKQVSFAPILRKPTKDELLTDKAMTELPSLKELTSPQKDMLIHTLWQMIASLRSQ